MNFSGWIIYNGHLPGQKFLDFAQWLQQAAIQKGLQTTIYKNNDLLAHLQTTSCNILTNKTDSLPDFVIFTDKDIYLAKQLEYLGVPVFNNAQAIEVSDDKIATYQTLVKHHLPIPETIIAPKQFSRTIPIDPSFVQQAADTLGLPMILKEAYGSFGEQVYFIHSYDDLLAKVKALQGKPFVFQQYIATSYGKDKRLHVVGEKVVAAMIRKASNDFRANVTAGGTMQAYEPSREEVEMAVRAVKAIGADFAGVDLLFGPDESALVCEVNSNAHIRNIYDCTRINVADFIIDHIVHKLKNRERNRNDA